MASGFQAKRNWKVGFINKVPVPYHWSYKLDDIDLAKEDISQIVYEVVNHKAANACDKDKRAPKPRTRKRQGQNK